MLEAIEPHEREILLNFPFYVQYINGKLPPEKFLKYIKKFKADLYGLGIHASVVRMMERTADAENRFHRGAAYNRFVRFCRKTGLDIATVDEKVVWLKKSNGDQFLDYICVMNGLLRGASRMTRWKNYDGKSSIVSGMFGTPFEPPRNGPEVFKSFYDKLVRKISRDNVQSWAAKLYFAIVFTHIFPDANGRVARHAYHFLTQPGILHELGSSVRKDEIDSICLYLTRVGILRLMVDDKVIHPMTNQIVTGNNFEDDYFCVDYRYEPHYTGESSHIRFIAANRMFRKFRTSVREQGLDMTRWPKRYRREFKSWYERTKFDWFNTCIDSVDDIMDRVVPALNSILLK